jgi:hypothetical protein
MLNYFAHVETVYNKSCIVSNEHRCNEQFWLIDEVPNDVGSKYPLLFVELNFKLVGSDERYFHPAGKSRSDQGEKND